MYIFKLMFDAGLGDPPHDNLMSHRWLLQGGLILIVLCCKVMCSAVFEVSILKLHNNRGVTHNGRCCSGPTTSPPCSGSCRTFVSACLMQYTQSMPLHRTCTYGSNVSSIIGANNINNNEEADEPLLQMDVNFSWPGKFTLIVETWHHTGSDQVLYDSSQLIAQAFVSNTIYPDSSWVNDTTSSPTTELHIRYRLQCDKWYHGAGCDAYCRPRDQEFGGHFDCDENGNRVCKPGWKGTFCDRPRCSEECLNNNATCDRPFECRCRLGYQGLNCGECRPYTGCLRGYCHKPYQCICEDGWTGQLCDIDTRYCQRTQPCEHGGTCISDVAGNYTCLCPNGFGGDNCEFPLCYPGYCRNGGICQTRRGVRECLCTKNYYGDQCEHERVTCQELTCKHGGQCIMGKYGAYCECSEKYTGIRCENRIHPCSSNPCENDAECRADDLSKHGFMCICRLGWGGLYCSISIDPCSGYTCYNDGKCRFKKGQNKPFCDCRSGFHGKYCEHTSDPCKNKKCDNGGVCKPSPMGNGFICQCSKGYHGEMCESKMNPCESEPCLNGGKCKNYISTFLCVCSEDYSGKICESKKFDPKEVRAPQIDETHEDLHTEIKDNEPVYTSNAGTFSASACILTTSSLIFHFVKYFDFFLT